MQEAQAAPFWPLGTQLPVQRAPGTGLSAQVGGEGTDIGEGITQTQCSGQVGMSAQEDVSLERKFGTEQMVETVGRKGGQGLEGPPFVESWWCHVFKSVLSTRSYVNLDVTFMCLSS